MFHNANGSAFMKGHLERMKDTSFAANTTGSRDFINALLSMLDHSAAEPVNHFSVEFRPD